MPFYESKTEIDIEAWIKKMLELEQSRPGDRKILSNNDLKELLKDGAKIKDELPRSSIFGYPSRPLYRDLALRIREWMDTGICPIELLPKYDLLDEKDYDIKRGEIIDQITSKIKRLPVLFSCWSYDEKMYSFREIFEILGKRGLLDMLGMRKTVGTLDKWPPPRSVIMETFTRKQNPTSPSELTVGARALAKHFHRDQSTSWWGNCTGSERDKNDHALKKVTNILDNATWLNIHSLPNEISTIEARQENGYGVRWTLDGSDFRGFLEPQMVDGHEVGWRH